MYLVSLAPPLGLEHEGTTVTCHSNWAGCNLKSLRGEPAPWKMSGATIDLLAVKKINEPEKKSKDLL